MSGVVARGSYFLIAWIVAGCASGREGPEMMMKAPREKLLFVGGPAIDRFDALERWLLEQRGIVGLPFVVRLTESKLGVRDGLLGERSVHLDDTALGISLFDRTVQARPNSDKCALWLEGYYRGGERGFSVKSTRSSRRSSRILEVTRDDADRPALNTVRSTRDQTRRATIESAQEAEKSGKTGFGLSHLSCAATAQVLLPALPGFL